MKIHNFHSSTAGDLTRVTATVTWEECDEGEREIYVATPARFARDLRCNPHAFLLGAVIPAMRRGERRVQVEGALCPHLRNGVTTAMQVLARWYGKPPQGPVTIEATEGFAPRGPRQPQRTASFMSGGVDSLATLRCNRLDFPLEHPDSIRDCFFVHGFDIGAYEGLGKNLESFALAAASLSELAESANVTLIPIYTNIRCLEGKDIHPLDRQLASMGFHGQLFTMASHGAIMAGIGHAFSDRVTKILVASTASIFELAPLGSHPLLDPNYSSSEVCILHDGARFDRLEKVRLIAEWDEALKTLRACGNYFRPSTLMNCGRCEKCLRTMTELLVFGKLKECPTFPFDDVSADMLRTIRGSFERGGDPTRPVLHQVNVYHWAALIDPLKELGRTDLSDVVQATVAEYETYQRRLNRKAQLKQFDRQHLGGALHKLSKRLRRAGSSR